MQSEVMFEITYMDFYTEFWWIYIQFRASVYVAGDANRLVYHFDSLVQDCSNSSALARGWLQSCTKASICIQENVIFVSNKNMK